MFKVEREKYFHIVKDWIAGGQNHHYWSATARADFVDVIKTKWTLHIRNFEGKHYNHLNALFQKCLNDKWESRKLIRIGIYFLSCLI